MCKNKKILMGSAVAAGALTAAVTVIGVRKKLSKSGDGSYTKSITVSSSVPEEFHDEACEVADVLLNDHIGTENGRTYDMQVVKLQFLINTPVYTITCDGITYLCVYDGTLQVLDPAV